MNLNTNDYIVYKHICPNGKVYIGITTKKPNYRFGRDGKNYIGCPLFWNAIQKFGWGNIKHEILFRKLSRGEAEQKEIELIRLYRSNDLNFGYNLDNGGHACGMHSINTRQKMSLSHIGNHHSEETKKKISRANKGKKRTDEDKAKYRKAKRGRTLSEEHKKNIGFACKGEKNGMFGKHHSEEAKKKIRLAVSGENNGKAKKVICIETNQVFDTAAEASNEYKVHRNTISGCCLGKIKTVKGKHFKYLKEM